MAPGGLFMRMVRKVRAQFIVGILIMVPVAATVLIFIWVFNLIDGILRPVEVLVFGKYLLGVGFVATALLIYIAGVIGNSLIGARLIKLWDSAVRRVPVVRTVYSMAKQITDGFSNTQTTGFRQVVLIDYPRKDVKSIAFVTNEFSDSAGKKLYSVFVPTTPNVTSGFLRLVASEEITRTSLSVDDAIKILVSFGRTAPQGVGDKLQRGNGEDPSEAM